MIGVIAIFWITILALLTQKCKISFLCIIACMQEIHTLSLAGAEVNPEHFLMNVSVLLYKRNMNIFVTVKRLSTQKTKNYHSPKYTNKPNI